MKFKLIVLLTACVLTMGLLPSTSEAQEAPEVIFDPANSQKATGINNLNIGGTLYNVAFTTLHFANEVYGPYPGVYDFTTIDSAGAAVDTVDLALTAAGATSVGAEGTPEGAVQALGVYVHPPPGVCALRPIRRTRRTCALAAALRRSATASGSAPQRCAHPGNL